MLTGPVEERIELGCSVREGWGWGAHRGQSRKGGARVLIDHACWF